MGWRIRCRLVLGIGRDALIVGVVEVIFVDDECVERVRGHGDAVEDALEEAGEGGFAAGGGAGYAHYQGIRGHWGGFWILRSGHGGH